MSGVCRGLKSGTKTPLHTFYAETDGQTEMVNYSSEQYLNSYYSYQQYDWMLLLPFVQYAYNILVSEPAQACHFEFNYGLTPQTK